MGSNRKTTAGASMPLGFGFHPAEDDLVKHYLKKKKHDKNFKVDHIIPEIDFYKYEPWDIPVAVAALLFAEPDSPYHDREWFVFSLRDYKYRKSTRSNRATPKGQWRITGNGSLIRDWRSKAVIGKKRILTFHVGSGDNAKKTNWVMHEYSLVENETIRDPKLAQRDFVLCRLKKNPDKKGKKDTSICAEGEPSSCNVSNCEDQVAAVVTPGSQDYNSSTLQSPAYIELGDVLQANGIIDDCNDMQSPLRDNDYSVTHNNDISTCDEGEPYGITMPDFENDAADDMLRELLAQPEKNLDPPLQLHFTQQSPTYTKMRDVMDINVVNEECLRWQSQFVSHTASDFENQAADNMFLEQPCAQPHQPHDYRSSTLQAPIDTKMGSVLHADVYNDDCQSAFLDYDSYLTKDKNHISTNDDDNQVSNIASNFENEHAL